MKFIALNNGLLTSVSDEDYEEACKIMWLAFRVSGSAYGKNYKYGYKPARRIKQINGKYKMITLYNYLMKPEPGFVVDHIDGNTLNNCRENLRICSRKDNSKNRKKKSQQSSSKYLGVSYIKANRKFRADIRVNGELIYLGSFSTEEEAAEAYNNASLKYHNGFGRLNNII